MSQYNERQKDNNYEWRKQNPERWRELQLRSAKKRREKYHNDPAYREKLNKKVMDSYRKTRLECLINYGGNPPKCDCCHVDKLEFLAIDHINGGGHKHKKEWKEKGFGNLYNYLKANKFPKGFRVLCHNCNQSLGHYGYCPHSGELYAKGS